MKLLTKLTKTFFATAIAVGAMTAAHALPLFSINPSAVGGALNTDPSEPLGYFTGDSLEGTAQSFLQITTATTIVGHGWLRMGTLLRNSVDVTFFASPTTNPLAADVILWAEYTYQTTLTSGSIGALGSNYNITALSFNIYGEKNDAGTGGDSVFTNADPLNSSSASVIQSADTVKLGSGTLISGVAAFNAGGGSSFTPKMLFALTSPDGDDFFPLPDDFYPFAFSSSTNTFQGFTVNTVGGSAVIAGPGSVDFNAIPEPGSIALLGLGLLGLAASRRRMIG